MRNPTIPALLLGLAWALARATGRNRSARLGFNDLDYRPRSLAGFGRPKRPRGQPRPEPGGVPVRPNRPNTQFGGAAAALEFDRD